MHAASDACTAACMRNSCAMLRPCASPDMCKDEAFCFARSSSCSWAGKTKRKNVSTMQQLEENGDSSEACAHLIILVECEVECALSVDDLI